MSLFRTAPKLQHGDHFILDGATVRLRVDGRARRVSLRIDQTAGEVIATAPNTRRLSEAVDFARSRAVWIAGHEDDDYVRTDAGWRVRRMVVELAFVTPFDQGWAKRNLVG